MQMGAKPDRALWGLLRRRWIVMPTWRGWLLLGTIAVFLLGGCVRGLYPFLAAHAPSRTDVLVTEGWIPENGLKEVAAAFQRDHCRKIYLTGCPIEKGADFLPARTVPDLMAMSLLKLGLTSNDLVVVAASDARQDRTIAAARALRQRWSDRQGAPQRVNLMVVGPHARRARLLFEKVLGDGVEVGVVAVPPSDYNPRRWWRYSAGFRTVTSELIGYIFARFFFHPAPGSAS